MRLDHLAVAAADLDQGCAWVRAALGAAPGPGGRHQRMGTWNRLLSLGPDEYLEVIAVDPAAPPPGRPRWFDLDRFTGTPRLTNWILSCDDLDAQALPGAGQALDFQRGAYHWRMAVPAEGRLPFDGAQPAQIQWQGPHPAAALPDSGCRLARLVIETPDAEILSRRLAALTDPRIFIVPADVAHLWAQFDTPDGRRRLG